MTSSLRITDNVWQPKKGRAGHAKLWLGLTLTLCIVLPALLFLFWQPWPPDSFSLTSRLQGPSVAHWLGTDVMGRDILTLLMGGAYNAIKASFIAVSIGLFFGVAAGLAAAFCRGVVDELIMRACDFAFAFPAILLAIMFIAVFGPGITVAIVAIGLANVPVFARLTRNSVRTLLPRDFVLAARALGRSSWGIMSSHILPNVLPVIIVQASVQLSTGVLAEAALSYLGLGTQPPSPSWGRMLSEAQTLLFNAPMQAIIPGAAIALTVLGFNQFGDGLRDWLDPRLHSRR